MDRISFLRQYLVPKYGAEVAERLLRGKRQSSIRQQEIAWRSLQEFLASSSWEEVSLSCILSYMGWLRDIKSLQSSTILNYVLFESPSFFSIQSRVEWLGGQGDAIGSFSGEAKKCP